MCLKRTLALVLLCGAVGCTDRRVVPGFDEAAEQPAAIEDSLSAQAIARRYSELTLVTQEPVEVDPYLAWYCISPEGFAARRKERSGPHAGAAVRIFMSENAAAAFRAGEKSHPVGAVIVKEKQRPESQTPGGESERLADGVGGMIKRSAGYDPEHGDWEYFYFEDPAQVEHGRIELCVECHRGAKATDHVFGDWAEVASSAAGNSND